MLLCLQRQGLERVVLCPGSRSAPLALAAGGLADQGVLWLTTAIDERSAAFYALGMAAASGHAAAVITTSGTAVANLLPAAVEADRSGLPLLLLTADRPQRLKNCGANQTVNQEDFLAPVCRLFSTGPLEGLHRLSPTQLDSLASEAWLQTLVQPGPVHLNLPFEEPLHPSREDQQRAWSGWDCVVPQQRQLRRPSASAADPPTDRLEWSRPGVVVAGPWRGLEADRPAYQQALRAVAESTGWPVLADQLAAIPADLPNLIRHWELLLPQFLPAAEAGLQVLRLGPLPASRRLESWLRSFGSGQLLITEGDPRCLDPLGLSRQCSSGLAAWWNAVSANARFAPFNCRELLSAWSEADAKVQGVLDQHLPAAGGVTEPALMKALPELLPQGLPLMLAASSPVRDWQTFAAADLGSRRCFSFRGASGIDGTLSLAIGLARVQGPTVLICGDLALQHDSNGWLLASESSPPLLVLLIDNAGGGIFAQLPIASIASSSFDQLFAMPQRLDPLALAAAHAVPARQLSRLEDLPSALEWGLAQQRTALLRMCTDRTADAGLRRQLRELAVAALQQSRGGTTEA
ncbi:2-succinyl-5-enolpyruvyl-6-hydroxy-3-cyclohexene-1-carboxylic-acid synthase [Synechococcus sp. MIT S9509]|uniref:2-succinyl-5-enolpyruvyl-6-hydroxy-3- cyclohexene-1-carboxylic-acid synthase n=1 Tax=Synechococcus sp. MIT S9509 TaxID=1801630 RepID=UPI00083711F7|nr:2-succinyl-5-enolpyruvyl-6-hydroxy-3-cyclohexene-1-carboxylic-acid synthase [Synechococcus sp. MIT S9509]